MTSLTALMRTGVAASAPGAPGEPFATLLAEGMPTAEGALTPDMKQVVVETLPELPPFPIDPLPVMRQPSAATGNALPPVAVDGAALTANSLPGPVPGATVPQSPGQQSLSKAPAAPWTPEQVRDDGEEAVPRSLADTPEISVADEHEDKPDKADASSDLVTTILPPVIVPGRIPLQVEAPAASDAGLAALTPIQAAPLSMTSPRPDFSPIETARPAQPAMRANQAPSPFATHEAAKQLPVEGQRAPAPVIAFMRPQSDTTPATAIPAAEIAAAPDSPRGTPGRHAPQPEVQSRPSRDPSPQPALVAAPTASTGTDRLLRARPNTAFAREEIAVTIGPATMPPPPPVADIAAARDIPATAVDTQSADWMQSMIERIETIAGEQGQRETRLKLSPDALGEVELRLRETPDGTMVLDMDAVTPEARALLAEAAPRLVELSEARGLRLTMQSGAQGDGQSPPHREPHRPGADSPIPNRRAANGSTGESTDERIA